MIQVQTMRSNLFTLTTQEIFQALRPVVPLGSFLSAVEPDQSTVNVLIAGSRAEAKSCRSEN